MSANLAEILTESARRDPEGIAVKLDDFEAGDKLLDESAARVGGMLRERGVGPGDRVGIMLPNVPYFPVVYYSVLRLGAVVVPMNALLKGREVEFYLRDPEAKVLFAWHDFGEAAGQGAHQAGAEAILVKPGEFEQTIMSAEPVHDVAERAEDDTAGILYTSGTTGTPKGAELTHGNLGTNAAEMITSLIPITKGDVVLGALP